MNHGYGHEVPTPHGQQTHRPVTRYLVLISAGEIQVARLFLDSREQVAEFDAGAEEVASLSRGLRSQTGATGAEWDAALAAHTAQERAAAVVYALKT